MTRPTPATQEQDAAAAQQGSGPSLGKGAWDCDLNCEIPPEKEVR